MMTYPMHVAGLVRDLPICKVTEDFYIGAFIMFGDAELTVACARDLLKLAEELERRLEDCDKPITVAVMGCVVNGPGEASAADIGVAGGKGEGLIFRHGEVLYKVAQEKLLDALLEEIEKL
mgnify:CR=1 FL=1